MPIKPKSRRLPPKLPQLLKPELPAPTPTPAPTTGFFGSTHVVLAAHAEDNFSSMFDPWTSATFSEFLTEAVPFVTWAESMGLPLHFEPVPDFVAAAGVNFIVWAAKHGVRWDARAHGNSPYNAADTAAALEAAGAPFNGILGSYEDAATYAGTIKATRYPSSYRWTVLTGGASPGHTADSYKAGLQARGDQVLLLGGRADSFAHTTAVSKAVASGKLQAGVVKQMFNLGRRKDKRAGFLCTPIGHLDRPVEEQTGGETARSAVERNFTDAPDLRYESVKDLVASWTASGKVDYVYDAATIGSK